MKADTQLANILSEDFEMPDCTCDLQTVIEYALIEYEDKPKYRHEKREFKSKLNELIKEYNERRGMKIYVYLK